MDECGLFRVPNKPPKGITTKKKKRSVNKIQNAE